MLFATRNETLQGVKVSDAVAIKVYVARGHDERFERETRAMERLRHRCLAALYEHGSVTDGSITYRYSVWERIDGEPLNDRIAKGTATVAEVRIVARDISDAIAELWANRIVHRDVNPKNIMLSSRGGNAVLLDLGIARHLGEPSITEYGSTWGTKGYMAPEHARAERQLTCKADVFSLGITLIEMLSGRHPTGGDQTLLLNPLDVVACAPNAPSRLVQLLQGMVDVRPVYRPLPQDVIKNLDGMLQ